MKFPKGWPARFFRPEIFSPGSLAAANLARAEAAFAAKVLDLKRGSRLLDVCCGTGRHSFALARRGVLVTGADATAAYLAQARRRARGLGNPIFTKADMRRLPWRGEFDAAVNLWTSFGYFERPSEDLLALRQIARALKPRGRFLMDVVNGAWLKRHGLARNWRREPGGTLVLEEAVFRQGRDPAHVNTWTVLRPGQKPARASFFVRHYDAARMEALLRRAGLRPLRRWGGFGGRPYSKDSTRLIVLAEKAGAEA
ncbi:MAG TPA: methyltransferase domain-containing protein [Elusimicrobiota bacterium]|nr:methyltransferase domain-containing protein [Elusimicrobiota bacterium]